MVSIKFSLIAISPAEKVPVVKALLSWVSPVTVSLEAITRLPVRFISPETSI